MILLVRLEMLRKHRDARAQQSNLYFWRSGVGFVALIPGENLLLCFYRQCHCRGKTPCLLLISLWYVNRIPQAPYPMGDAWGTCRELVFSIPEDGDGGKIASLICTH